MKAYCYASGQIEFAARAEDVPHDGIMFASGPKKKLMDFISGVARHAYDGETLLVPGIPETRGDQVAAGDALRKWCDWIAQNPPDGVDVL